MHSPVQAALIYGVHELGVGQRLRQHDGGAVVSEGGQVLGQGVARDADHHPAVAQLRPHPARRLRPVHADHHIVQEHEVYHSAGRRLRAEDLQGGGAVVRLQYSGAVSQHSPVRAALQHATHDLPVEV